MTLEKDRVGFISSLATIHGDHRSAPERLPTRQLDQLLVQIGRDSATLADKIRTATRLLVAAGEWTAAIRLVVTVGGHQQADVARRLGVMRSTVARWYNGETKPAEDQLRDYATKLDRMLEGRDRFYLKDDAPLLG